MDKQILDQLHYIIKNSNELDDINLVIGILCNNANEVDILKGPPKNVRIFELIYLAINKKQQLEILLGDL